MTDLIKEFSEYINDIFTNQPIETIPDKLKHVLGRFQDATIRQVSSTMLEIDLDCSGWSNERLGEKMVQHVKFRSSPNNMLPAHCMMLEAGKRLKRSEA